MLKTFYIIAIQGSGVAEMTSGHCLYSDYREAEKKLNWYKEHKMNYMRIFYVYLQDVDAVALAQSQALACKHDFGMFGICRKCSTPKVEVAA